MLKNKTLTDSNEFHQEKGVNCSLYKLARTCYTVDLK